MLRSRLSIAVIFSIVMVVGAMWVRYTNAKELSVEKSNQIELDSKNFQPSAFQNREEFERALGTNQQNNEGLSSTDLIGRQMFSDYMNLVSKGQATDENIAQLAGTYAQGMLRVTQNQSPKTNINELKITQDTQITYQSYSSQTSSILNKYSSLFESNLKKAGISGEIAPEDLSKFGSALYPVYQQMAQELIKIQVPSSLKETHLNLINSYLESAHNLELLKNLNADPVTALSAFNTQITNFETEMTLISNVRGFLESKGVVFNFSS